MTGEGPHADATLAGAIGEFFPGAGIPAVVVMGSHDVVVIFPWSGPAEEVTDLARRMVAYVNHQTASRTVVVGLGGVAEQSRLLRVPLRLARDACLVLRRSGEQRIAHLDDLGTYRLLLGAQGKDTRQRFADSVLGPLREHDAKRAAQLETTVRTFIEHNGHWTATAAALFIHVNTLRNRLAKVADLTGHDVTTTEGRVEVFLALEADQMLSSE
jgi:sugar diacid utilization regulator